MDTTNNGPKSGNESASSVNSKRPSNGKRKKNSTSKITAVFDYASIQQAGTEDKRTFRHSALVYIGAQKKMFACGQTGRTTRSKVA